MCDLFECLHLHLSEAQWSLSEMSRFTPPSPCPIQLLPSPPPPPPAVLPLSGRNPTIIRCMWWRCPYANLHKLVYTFACNKQASGSSHDDPAYAHHNHHSCGLRVIAPAHHPTQKCISSHLSTTHTFFSSSKSVSVRSITFCTENNKNRNLGSSFEIILWSASSAIRVPDSLSTRASKQLSLI